MSHEQPTSVLATPIWWRHLVERVGRQFAQTALPILAVLITAPGSVSGKAWVVATLISVAVTLGKATVAEFVAITPNADAALTWRLLDRAVPAAAGVLLGLWPVSAEGLASFDLRAALVAAGAAGVSAIVALYATPPVYAPTGPDGVPDVSSLPDLTGDDDQVS